MRLTIALLAFFATIDTAHAECATASGVELDAEAARVRVQQLEASIERNRRHMKIWNTTWISIYSAAAVGQGTLALVLDDEDDQAVYAVGAAKGVIAAAAIPIIGVRTRHLTLINDPCEDLARAEAVLAENVRLHAKGRGWLKHAGVIALNLGGLLALGLGFDLWERGAIGAGIGLAVGEVQIFSQPMGSRKLLRDYERRDTVAIGSGVQLYVAPTVTEHSVGVAVYGVVW